MSCDARKTGGLGVNENKICIEALNIGRWDVFLLAGRYTILEQCTLDNLFQACRNYGTSIIALVPLTPVC